MKTNRPETRQVERSGNLRSDDETTKKKNPEARNGNEEKKITPIPKTLFYPLMKMHATFHITHFPRR